MDNPEKLATLGKQDTRWRQTKQKNTPQKTKKMSNMEPTKIRMWTQVLVKGKQFLDLISHL